MQVGVCLDVEISLYDTILEWGTTRTHGKPFWFGTPLFTEFTR
jgi:hypothetical protein